MQLERLYDRPDGWEPERDAAGLLLNRPPLKGLKLHHTGTEPQQNFSRRLLDVGIEEGWLSMARGAIVITTEQGDLHYTIDKTPGTYCGYCQAKLDDDTTGQAGFRHVREFHEGATNPDPSNPHGFRVTNAYECTLAEEQHARFNVRAMTEAAQRQATPVQPQAGAANGHPTAPEAPRG